MYPKQGGFFMSFDLAEILATRRMEASGLHETYLNTQLVRLLKTIGFYKTYTRAKGPYLFDETGEKYLDLLGGFGTFGIGRNHPKIVTALKEALDADLPNMVQMDASLLAGLLAEKLATKTPPSLKKVFFCNSGTEAVEAVIKFARMATGRKKILYCDHAFHGLTNGSLSLNGEPIFREGFEPLLGECHAIPFHDLNALELALRNSDVACWIVEPIQGKTLLVPGPDYFPEAKKLCEKYGTLLCMDEVQTGLGRTGKFFCFEHWGMEPDLIAIAKTLSGGFVPVGAVITKEWIFNKVFSRLDKAVIHGSTFSKNNLAMVAGLAALTVIEEEDLVAKAKNNGEILRSEFKKFAGKYELVSEVRGLGMMLGIEFGSPKSLSLKTAWKLLEKANKGLFCQMITIPLFKKHRILSQVAGHGSHMVKILPTYDLSAEDLRWIVSAFDETIAEAHRFPGAVWDLAMSLAGHALKA